MRSFKMEEKNRYLFLEFLFTFFLLLPVIFLFGDTLSRYRLYLILCLIGGFSYSWFNRNKQTSLMKIFINLPVLGVFAWMIYSLLNSSLLYREVILTFIKGVIILEVIFSFSSCYPSFLTHIQVLSLPLLMCFPVFVKDYNGAHAILVLLYIICWIMILRVKLYKFVKPLNEKRVNQRLAIFISLIIFLIIIFVSWLIFCRLSLGRIEKGGFLPEENKGPGIESETLEKEYYDLQDKAQDKISQLIPEFNSKEDRQAMLLLLSTLIKESPSVVEIKKVELGLISRLKTPGPGLEKAKTEEASVQIKNYLDKKVLFNLKNIREDIMNNLKRNRFNIIEKISIMNQINKMQSSDSYQKIKKYERELRQIINNSSAGDNAKRDLQKPIGQFKEWKMFEVYRRNMDSLNKKLDSLDEQLKKGFSDLLSDINNTENISDLKEAQKRLEKLKETFASSRKDLIKESEEISDLASEMHLLEKARDLKEKIDSFQLPENYSQELKEKVDDIKDAQDYKKFLESLSKYQEKIEENRINVSGKTKELLEIKTHLLFNEKKEKIRDELKKSNLPDKGANLLKDLEKLESEKKMEKLISDSKKLKENIEKLSNQGFISNASKDNLIKESEEIKDFLLSGLKAQEKAGESEASKEAGAPDYRNDWEELIEKASLKEERKEALRQLAKELSKAQEIAQVENIKEAAQKEIENLTKDKVKQEKIREIKEAFDLGFEIKRMFIIEKALAALREKIEDLQQVNPQEAEKIQKLLEKIRSSHTNEQLISQIDALKEYLSSKEQGSDLDKKSQKIKDNLIKEIEEIKDHILSKLKSEIEEKGPAKEKSQADYQRELKGALEESSLRAEKQDALGQLAEQLSQAQTLSQVENIKEAIENEIESLDKEGIKKEEIGRLKEKFKELTEIKSVSAIEKEFSTLREKIEDLQQVNPQEAEKIQKLLEKIRSSHTNEQLISQIDALKEYLNSEKQDQVQEKKPEEIKKTGILDIYILPSHLVMPIGSSVSLKAVAVYNKIVIKEIGSESEWLSSRPYVAWVDEKGIIHSLAKGKTQIYANYNGTGSQEVEVTVVDKIDEQLDKAVEMELVR